MKKKHLSVVASFALVSTLLLSQIPANVYAAPGDGTASDIKTYPISTYSNISDLTSNDSIYVFPVRYGADSTDGSDNSQILKTEFVDGTSLGYPGQVLKTGTIMPGKTSAGALSQDRTYIIPKPKVVDGVHLPVTSISGARMMSLTSVAGTTSYMGGTTFLFSRQTGVNELVPGTQVTFFGNCMDFRVTSTGLVVGLTLMTQGIPLTASGIAGKSTSGFTAASSFTYDKNAIASALTTDPAKIAAITTALGGMTTKANVPLKMRWVDYILYYGTDGNPYVRLKWSIYANTTATEPIGTYNWTIPLIKPTGDYPNRYLALGAVGIGNDYKENRYFADTKVTYDTSAAVDDDMRPTTLGAKIPLDSSPLADQKLRLDFNFATAKEAAANYGITIVEYGVKLSAGTQPKAPAMLSEQEYKKTVTTVDDIPDTLKLVITNSSDNVGKRISAIPYVKDSNGNYYFARNNSSGIVADGVAAKSVIGVMKAYFVSNLLSAPELGAAVDAYNASSGGSWTIDSVNAAAMNSGVTIGSEKDLLRNVFHHYYVLKG